MHNQLIVIQVKPSQGFPFLHQDLYTPNDIFRQAYNPGRFIMSQLNFSTGRHSWSSDLRMVVIS